MFDRFGNRGIEINKLIFLQQLQTDLGEIVLLKLNKLHDIVTFYHYSKIHAKEFKGNKALFPFQDFFKMPSNYLVIINCTRAFPMMCARKPLSPTISGNYNETSSLRDCARV